MTVAAIAFNGVSVTFLPTLGGQTSTFKVRSHSESGNDRPDIDVTTSGDGRRVVMPGLANPTKHTFEVVVDSQAERGKVLGWLDDCAAGTLTCNYTPCGGSATALFSVDAWVTGFAMSGELDGVWTYSIEFTVDHAP